MRITGVNGSIPLHMARAYGVKPGGRAAPVVGSSPVARAQPADTFQATSSAQRLVAGKVSQPVNFDSPAQTASRVPTANQVFQMYTRAADKVEAAVAVQLGRTIDFTA